MNDAKYIGLDVHQATISVAVLDSSGKLVMEAILETQTSRVQDNFRVADHPGVGTTVVCVLAVCPSRAGRWHSYPVPRQNHDQLLNQHLANRPVTLLKSEIQLLSESWRRTG